MEDFNGNARDILLLKAELKRLQESEERLEAKVSAMEAEVKSTSRKVTTAETWGRVIMYCTFGAGVVVSNLSSLATWYKKL